MVMIRKQIYLDAATDRELKREARRRGVSQAALIRERLASPQPGHLHEDAGSWLMDRLQHVIDTAGTGPGTGWKFNREEIYAERLDRQDPRRYKRPGVRGGRARGGQS